MRPRFINCLIGFAAFFAVLTGCSANEESVRPNIILLMADDQGWVSVTNFFDINPLMSDQGEFKSFEGTSSKVIVDMAMQFIRKNVEANQPFFAVITGDYLMWSQVLLGISGDLKDLSGKAVFASPQLSSGRLKFTRGSQHTLLRQWIFFQPWPISWTFPGREVMGSPVDGISIQPIFSKEIPEREVSIPFRFTNKGALIDNNYKLVATNRRMEEFELYDLGKDPGETVDISGTYPDIFNRMKNAYLEWSASVDASVRGEDYPEGKVREDHPESHFWIDDPRYEPYLDTWVKRPEYEQWIEKRR